jgi:hypothetical protein
MSREEYLKSRKEIDETISKLNVMIYGFDISTLHFKEQQRVEEQRIRRAELEAMKERLNPKPKPKLSKAEELEVRRMEALEAKIDKIAKGRPVKELSNGDLEKQLKIMRAMVK